MSTIVLSFPRKVIAKRMGCDYQFLCCLLKRQTKPNLSTLERLAEASEISIHDWVDFFIDPSVSLAIEVTTRTMVK